MTVARLDALGRYDCLFVSPHADDVAFSSPARVFWEAKRGQRVLVLALFEEPGADSPAMAVLDALGADFVAAGLAPGRARLASDSYGALAFGRGADDEEWLVRAARLLADVEPIVRARQVYAPLGVGGHIDHRLAHEAALRAFSSGDGRNVYLYEERPEALVRGAVRVRLGLLGARLPPAAAEAPDRTGLTRYLLNVHVPPSLRGDLRGLSDRLRSSGGAVREWRLSRAWNPQKAFGPRLQPVVHAADADALAAAHEATGVLFPADARGRVRRARRFEALSAAYARRLGVTGHAERFWLLLPSPHGAQEMMLPTAVGQD
jgi:LmbE family N-acetylglucosaminyl deacetylase